ncbi:MAG TPA: hypothetical protein RMH99_14825 [Sandaracinaceae bacterium LLY-WYZ-13_1]|nr:hypothetical protein [Sandaracinaceae bacterium LLY-WYZ-13_1]
MDARRLVVALSLLSLGIGCGARSGLDPGAEDEGRERPDAAVPDASDADRPLPPPAEPPPPPPPGRRALRVVAGVHHACLLDESGGVRCWGSNRRGSLGLDEAVRGRPRPIEVEGIAPLVALAGGHSHTIGIDAEGRLWGWGSSANGQLLHPVRGPAPPGLVSGLELPPAAGVAAGDAETCVRFVDGEIRCWGRRYSLRAGPMIGPEGRPMLDDAVELAGGLGHYCGVDGDGRPLCWGQNERGEIGLPAGSRVHEPRPLPGVPRVDQLALGFAHSCARLGAEVWCWGDNGHGECGVPEPDLVPPTRVEGLPSNVATLFAGWSATCAILETGRVLCWGENGYGQLGDGTRIGRVAPTEVRFAPGVRVVQMAAGANFACAVDDEGRVWCWGDNARGQLGDGTEEDRLVPVPVAL